MSSRAEQGKSGGADAARRRFLAKAGVGAAAVGLAPTVTLFNLARARSPDEPVTDARRWGLLVDASKCASGCDACVRGCNDENGLTGHGRPATDAQ